MRDCVPVSLGECIVESRAPHPTPPNPLPALLLAVAGVTATLPLFFPVRSRG